MYKYFSRKCKVEATALVSRQLESIQSPLPGFPDTPRPLWTPGCMKDFSSDSDISYEEPESRDALAIFNNAIKEISDVSFRDAPKPLAFQLQKEWDIATKVEQQQCIEKASEACRVICSFIAPKAVEALYKSLSVEKEESNELKALMTAYANAPTKQLKTQILSIYAHEHTIKQLQELHEPFEKVSEWQIKRAREHAKQSGPGLEVCKPKTHRISLDMSKVDHFLDFANRPYFHQDVAFGMRKLKLKNGEVIEMPNVIRTVTRATMIYQYQKFCSNQNPAFVPLSRSTLYRILDAREASQRKSLSGLDNIAADGESGIQTLKTITGQLVYWGVSKEWAEKIKKRLDNGKNYLKTDYKVHCKEEVSPCADHCRHFGLSDPNDKDFQELCSHSHDMTCEHCEDIKAIHKEIESKLQNHSHSSYTKDHRDDLLYDFAEAKRHIEKWKAHILRSANQELAKQNVLRDLDDSSILLIIDWAMKFTQLRYALMH